MTDSKITLTYVNIRQSIAILLSKLILTDLILAVIVVGFYYVLVQGEKFNLPFSTDTLAFFIMFAVIGIIKIFTSIYVVLKWLNEYYEITPEFIVHKQGIIFKKSDHYKIELLRRVSVQDSFLGQLLNFATITLFDIRLNKYLDMYLVHNPNRYAKILKQLKPEIELIEDRVWMPFKAKRDLVDYESK